MPHYQKMGFRGFLKCRRRASAAQLRATCSTVPRSWWTGGGCEEIAHSGMDEADTIALAATARAELSITRAASTSSEMQSQSAVS